MRGTCLSTTLLLAGVLLGAAPAQASPALAAKGGCAACHAMDKPMIGPTWQAIAAKYKGQADAPARLAAKVRQGSAGAWGKLPMAPVPADKVSDADLQALVSWVLKTR